MRASDVGGSLPPPDPEKTAPRAISEANAWIITDLLKDVIRRGTGQRARALGRDDIAGKTGTTNDGRDAWFSGFNPDLVATAWVGYDQERPLGRDEEGSRTALPMWIYFMREALAGVPEHPVPMPDGVVTARISADPTVLSEEAPGRVRVFPRRPPAGGHRGRRRGPRRAAAAAIRRAHFLNDEIPMARRSVRGDMMRQAIAREAARLMIEHGHEDYGVAKRKAAERFGVTDLAVLPKNTEIEEALAEHQRLFGPEEHASDLVAMRNGRARGDAAARAVRAAAGRARCFRVPPRAHNDITLHLFADTPEAVAVCLIDRGIPHEFAERRFRTQRDEVEAYPAVRFTAGSHDVYATIFPKDGIRQAPPGPVDGRPMRRATLAEVECLLQE